MNLYTFFVATLIGLLCMYCKLPDAHAATSAERFIKEASIGNMFEIESSKVALDKSKTKTVRDFAERMIDDHGKASEKLKETLDDNDIQIAPVTTLDKKHQKILNKLKSISDDKEFDRAYVKAQTSAHNDAVDLFRDYSKSGRDDGLKEFATQTLPTLESHHEKIHEIKKDQ